MTPAAFLEAHLAAHPEDASTLGIAGHAELLPDPALPPIAPAIEGADDDLDADAARRAAAFSARRREATLELAALPNAMLQHASLHARRESDWLALAARAHKVPAFLAAHRDLLRANAVDADVAKTFVERVLPGAADAVASLAFAAAAKKQSPEVVARVAEATREAREAYRAYAADVAKDVSTRADVVIGEEETAFRLSKVMGVDASPDDLVAEARSEIARLKTTLDRDALMKLLAPHAATLDDALAGYRRWLVEATNFVRDRELVPVPAGLALDLEPLPGGIADGAGVTNWPAPLFDPEGKGHVLYATDPRAHNLVSMKNLAVHEGIPGHYLQSVYWQRNAKREHAVRYLGVADDVAMSLGYFGTMLSVEGWAVHMEHLLRQHGFYDTREELMFADFCDAVRETRIVLDIELQRGRMTGEEAARFVAESTLMPEGWARAQVVRAKRIPLQGVTYQVGAREIVKLRKSFRGDDIDFYDELLALGPVPPSRAARVLCP